MTQFAFDFADPLVAENLRTTCEWSLSPVLHETFSKVSPPPKHIQYEVGSFKVAQTEFLKTR